MTFLEGAARGYVLANYIGLPISALVLAAFFAPFATLIALLVFLPIGYAAVLEERRERRWPHVAGFVPGDHRQYKRWIP